MRIGMIYCGWEESITGINRVIHECVNELLHMDCEGQYISIQENYLGFPINDSYAESKKIKRVNNTAKSRIIACYLENIDILHSFYSSIDDINYGCKKIITVHDILPLLHPEWFSSVNYAYFDFRIRKSVSMADLVLAVSESTKRDIVDVYGVHPNKVRVIYPGVYSSLEFAEIDNNVLKKFNLESEYILSVCTVEPRKNLRNIIKAFIQLKKSKNNFQLKLVVVGKMGWDYTFNTFYESLSDYKEDIVITGYVTNEELSSLYKSALCVIYASYYEGFGLPVLEALSVGKATITSNVSSMPEVGGDAVVYCDPYKIDSITSALEQVCYDSNLRELLEKKSIVQASKFSYRKMAKETLDVYHEVMQRE